jgi:antitoxin (DNA-binding transcriptional repressor) of toxin-antitoxin stability system
VKAVGVRELKNRLSEYLRWVKAGEEILVTERGEVIAELHGPTPRTTRPSSPGLEDLARAGLARLGTRNDPAAYSSLDPVLAQGAASRLLDAERGER